ncbi:hypothetical protein K523DRAFT_145670 [Schizophyllum commune Tattone D]|nr:hypothetical protein K523DRAFT_145670 [Schizophyllum commune Tattone D]
MHLPQRQPQLERVDDSSRFFFVVRRRRRRDGCLATHTSPSGSHTAPMQTCSAPSRLKTEQISRQTRLSSVMQRPFSHTIRRYSGSEPRMRSVGRAR